MELIQLSLMIGEEKVHKPRVLEITKLPTLYALSKTGSVRVYEIEVEDMGEYAILRNSKRITLDGKITTDKYEFYEGVNIGKANETTYLEQAISVAWSTWRALKDKGFSESMPKEGTKFNTDANGLMKPMLAQKFNEKLIKFPCLAQPKYDGVRCFLLKNNEVKILSRKGKSYNVPHLKKWAEEHRDMLPLDGELYNHKELTFQEILSAVKCESEITKKIRYVVYDKPAYNITNDIRWDTLKRDFGAIGKKDVVYLSDSKILHNMDEVWEYHKKCTDNGYEGIIIRNFEGKYEFGFRSRNLIKLKSFDDAEFKVIGIDEASGRDYGTAIFVCQCKGGTFRVKPQGTRELRAEYFEKKETLIGKYATVQYQGLSDDGIPRFPSMVSIRDYE